jgi:hypothetical protein
VGPGGGGVCGTNCESYCELRAKVCSNVPFYGVGPDDPRDVSSCLSRCAALPDLGDFDAERDRTGDSLQCRLLYLSEAAISQESAAKYCEYSQIRPSPGEDPLTAPCSDADDVAPEALCDSYCGLVTSACVDDLAMYESTEQCLAVCGLLEPGVAGDQTQNTVRCRRYHAYFSLLEPEAHCMHAGPTGDGHCGPDNCNSYCRIAQAACPAAFADAFGAAAGAELAACESSCLELPGARRDEFALPPGTTARYRLEPPPTGNTVLCRSYHAVAALTNQGDPALCAAALGESPCR